MKRNVIFLTIGLFFMAPSFLFSEGNLLSEGKIRPQEKSYIYKKSGGKPREMEIYFPPGHDPSKEKVPGVILFHGGGWTSGDLSAFRIDCQYLASRGLVAATANYRMLSVAERKRLSKEESHKSVCVVDAKSAIRWFKQHAEELGVDSTRIITGGGSAGGHISVLATLSDELSDPTDPVKIDTSVVAYLLFNPAFHEGDRKHPEIDVLRFLKPDMAPAIAMYGTKDPWLKRAQPVFKKFEEIENSSAELWFAEGQKHAFFNKEPWKTATLLVVDRFLL